MLSTKEVLAYCRNDQEPSACFAVTTTTKLPKAGLLTFWFSHFGPVLVEVYTKRLAFCFQLLWASETNNVS